MEHTRKKRHEDCVHIRFRVRADTGTTTVRPETMNTHAIWRDGCSHPDGDGGDPDDGEGSDPGR